MGEILDIEFALTNYDWHYNLMALKEKLKEIEGFYFTYHIAQKAREMLPIKELEAASKKLLTESKVTKGLSDKIE